MAQNSIPWTGIAVGHAGPYTDDNWTDIWRSLFAYNRETQGVLLGAENELLATIGVGLVSIAAGRAVVDGNFYKNTSAVGVGVSTPSVSTRVDLIALKKDSVLQTVTLFNHTGVEGGSAPSPTQVAGTTWELPLWEVTITVGGAITITDRRKFCMFTDAKPNANILRNGDFIVSEMATTFDAGTTPANDDDTYLLDQWILLSDGDDIVDVTQQDDGAFGSSKYLRADVETANKKFGFLQILNSREAKALQDQKLSLSISASTESAKVIDNIRMAILAWDGAADVVTSDVVDGANWNAAGTDPTLVANWAYQNTPVDLVLKNHFEIFKDEGIDFDTASSNNLAVFIWVDDTDASVGDFLKLRFVKVEIGETSTPNIEARYTDELARCQDFLYVLNPVSGTADTIADGFYQTATLSKNFLFLPREMYQVPHTFTGTAADISSYDGVTLRIASSIGISGDTSRSVAVITAVVAADVQFKPNYLLLESGASSNIIVSAEL